MNNAPHLNKTSLGMDGNLAALLSYIIGIIGIIILITENENKFAKYHALHALFFHLSIAVFFLVGIVLLMVLGFVGFGIGAALGEAGAVVGIIVSALVFILWIALIILGPLLALGGNIYAAIQAYNGKWTKFPLIGNLAAKMLGIKI